MNVSGIILSLAVAVSLNVCHTVDAVIPQVQIDVPAEMILQERNKDIILVNPWNEVPEDYEVDLVHIGNGYMVDSSCYDALMEMLGDCREEGLSPMVCSAYRSRGTQSWLHSKKINQFIGYGYSRQEAEIRASEIVARPGTSEHQLGLAVDIVDLYNQNLNKSQENTEVQKWLMENCWDYGFILRYPTDKSDVTGIIYEPWHYRYVGVELSRDIRDSGLCLEEYLGK